MAKHGKTKIVLHIEVDPTKVRNEFHFNVQLRERSHTFVDRKKRAKNGYRKHKKDYE